MWKLGKPIKDIKAWAYVKCIPARSKICGCPKDEGCSHCSHPKKHTKLAQPWNEAVLAVLGGKWQHLGDITCHVEVIRKHSIHVNHNLSADMVQSWIDEKQRRCIISSFFSVLCPTFPPSLVNKNPFFQSSQPTIKRLQHWKSYMFNKKNGKPFSADNLECRPWNHQNPNIESVICFLLIS